MSRPSQPFSPVRRRFLALASTASLLPLAACGSLDFLSGDKAKLGTTVSSKAYRPVDPAQAVAAINAYRASAGSGPLTLDPTLGRAAREYAEHMAAAGKMSHALDPYGPIDRRLKTIGYAYATAGENIGEGYRDFPEVFEGWKRSPAHDRGMKDPEMTHMGIGSAYNPNVPYQVYWCLIFAKPRGANQPAGTGPFAVRW